MQPMPVVEPPETCSSINPKAGKADTATYSRCSGTQHSRVGCLLHVSAKSNEPLSHAPDTQARLFNRTF
jgi:hypothetical protein